jgi:hypothetical protein
MVGDAAVPSRDLGREALRHRGELQRDPIGAIRAALQRGWLGTEQPRPAFAEARATSRAAACSSARSRSEAGWESIRSAIGTHDAPAHGACAARSGGSGRQRSADISAGRGPRTQVGKVELGGRDQGEVDVVQ